MYIIWTISLQHLLKLFDLIFTNHLILDHPGIWARISHVYEWISTTVCEGHSEPKPLMCEGVTVSPTTSMQPTPSPTQSKTPTISPTAMECEDDEMMITLSLTTDQYGYETSWTLMEYSTLAILKSDSYLDSSKEHLYRFCLPCSKYEFNITDNYGDGMLEPGGYELIVDNTIIDKYSSNNDGSFKKRTVPISQSEHCPLQESCSSDEITLDISHFGMHHGTELRWAVEDTMSGELVHNRTDLKASQLNKKRLCLKCGKYIFKAWNDYDFAASGGLAVAVDGNIINRYNLLYDVGILNSTEFTGGSCPSYQKFKSMYDYLGVEFCMEPKTVVKNAVLVVKPCKDDSKQLWRPDDIGQFHAYDNDSLCIAKAGKGKMRLKPCLKKYSNNRGKSLAYSLFTKQLIWMNDAKRSVGISTDPRSDKEVIMKTYNKNSRFQQWIIEGV